MIIDFNKLRPDWYSNADMMARAVSRQLRGSGERCVFRSFPRQWIPLFELCGCDWEGSTPPVEFTPFFSRLTQAEVVAEIETAKRNHQLRLLVEVSASSDVVLCETLQRILAENDKEDEPDGLIALTNWHSYSRSSLRAYDKLLTDYVPSKRKALFMPCSKKRPYSGSPTHKRIFRRLMDDGINASDYELIVITSIGPVPECYWNEEVVLRYDTGIRDLYRLLSQLRRLLRGTHLQSALDVVPICQYGEILDILSLEGRLPKVERPKWLRRRHIQIYK